MAATNTGGSLLLVEEDQRLRQTLLRSLVGRNFAITAASTAAEAMTAASTHHFDLMLLDVNLPDATGWDVVRRLRATGSSMPVVVLSAAPPNPVRVRELQPFAVLRKPFAIDALLRLVLSASI